MSFQRTGLLAVAALISASSVAMAQNMQVGAAPVAPQPVYGTQQQAAYNAEQQAAWRASHDSRQERWQNAQYAPGPYDQQINAIGQ